MPRNVSELWDCTTRPASRMLECYSVATFIEVHEDSLTSQSSFTTVNSEKIDTSKIMVVFTQFS